MKKKWFSVMGLADESFIHEADPNLNHKKKGVAIKIVASFALIALLVGNMWLFWPHGSGIGDVSDYEDSAYYPIITRLNDLMSVEYPEADNTDDAVDEGMVPEWDGSDADMGTTGAGSTYQEITDNQVNGVIEADLIKRTDKCIYYLDENVLRVFNIDKEKTRELGSFTVTEGFSKNSNIEFYLSENGKIATLILDNFGSGQDRCVTVLSLDIDNPENITLSAKIKIRGKYISSRKVDGKILLFTEFKPSRNDIDFEDESTFLPQIDTGAGFESVMAENIILPDKILDTRYTVVLQLDEEGLRLNSTLAYLSYSDKFYVSEDKIYFTRVFAEKGKVNTERDAVYSRTEISVLSYSDNLKSVGSFTVDGYVNNQYSKDLHLSVP